MYIDIGALCREEAEKVVSLGDTAVFPPHYEEFGDGLIDAKAIDDRGGCAVLIRLLQNTYKDIQLVCAFTAQEGRSGGEDQCCPGEWRKTSVHRHDFHAHD